jgi:hypothetical protein
MTFCYTYQNNPHMIILPSLLEYSTFDLQRRIDRLNQLNKFEIHIDTICKQFAQSRNVMMSISTKTVLEHLQKFRGNKLLVTIHIMGDTEDLIEAYRFFASYHFEPNWQYRIYLPLNSELAFVSLESMTNVRIGNWYDIDQWDIGTDFGQYTYTTALLMTVKAGLSGQLLLPETKQDAFELAVKNPQINFIFDGGWSCLFDTDVDNVDLVSYTSYWRKNG